MATNPFFNSNYKGREEQTLLDGLFQECIQIQGYDIYYMPREDVNYDYLFGEDTHADFVKTYQLEAYIVNVDGYTGNNHIITKLGLDVQDELTLQIHVGRFREEITNNFPEITRPREGDLLYFGLDIHSIFEISFVEDKVPFFQLGDNYIYQLSLRRFVYGSQNIDTGIEEIDDVQLVGNTTTIQLGTTATPLVRFNVGEVAYQLDPLDLVTYTAFGEVLDHTDDTLLLRNVGGVFVAGRNILGETSGANYEFPVKDDQTFDDVSNNKVSDNLETKVESENYIDNTELNPFVDF